MNIEIPTEDGELVCVICYDKIGYRNTEGIQEQPVQLDCQHVFGNVCLDSWLTKKSRCPICRTKVDGYASASSSDGSDDLASSDSDTSNTNSDEGSDDQMDDSDEGIGEELDDEDEDSDGNNDGDSDSENDGDEEDSQVSETTHISISSDDSEASAMSVDSSSEHVEDEDMSEDREDPNDSDGGGDGDTDSEASSQYRSNGMTPQEILRRLASSTVAGNLMEAIRSGRIDMSTFLSQARMLPSVQAADGGDEDDESD